MRENNQIYVTLPIFAQDSLLAFVKFDLQLCDSETCEKLRKGRLIENIEINEDARQELI